MTMKKYTPILIAMLLIILVIGLGYITNKEVEDLIQQQFNEQQLLLTRQSATGIESFLKERTVLIEVLATELSDKSPEDMVGHFISVYHKSSGFSSIGFVNSTGVIVCGYPAENSAIGLDLNATNKSGLFDHAKESGETYTTNPVQLVQGGIGSTIGVPVYSGGEFKGVVFAIITISTISEQFLADAIPEGHGYVYMFTRKGRCLYDEAHKEIIGKQYIGQFYTNDSSFAGILQEQLENKEGAGYYFDDSSKERRIVAYTPVVWDNHIWIISTNVPGSEVEVLIHSIFKKQILFIGTVVGIILSGSGIIVLIFSRWNKELAKEVENKTDDLRRSNMDLESANIELTQLDKLKSEFISMVSHELKTPLTSIKISLDVLKSLSSSGKDDETKEEMIQIIDRNIGRQNRLVNDLLDISRIETGNLKLYLKPVDLYDIIRESVGSMKKIAEEKGISIHVDLKGESLQITADYDRLVQVFVNLINNALKFTQEGEIRIQARMVNGHPQIRVSDTGIGIPPEELDRIFDKFHQVDEGSTRQFGGSGLGLAICKGIIEQHGGSIRAESEVTKGSTFIIELF